MKVSRLKWNNFIFETHTSALYQSTQNTEIFKINVDTSKLKQVYNWFQTEVKYMTNERDNNKYLLKSKIPVKILWKILTLTY